MTSREYKRYTGACHCGAVRFTVETDFPELTMCDCSICKKKNALMVKIHESQFLYTDDFWRDFARFKEQGIEFVRAPAEQPYGTVAVFKDLYGNLWDLVQMKQRAVGEHDAA